MSDSEKSLFFATYWINKSSSCNFSVLLGSAIWSVCGFATTTVDTFTSSLSKYFFTFTHRGVLTKLPKGAFVGFGTSGL